MEKRRVDMQELKITAKVDKKSQNTPEYYETLAYQISYALVKFAFTDTIELEDFETRWMMTDFLFAEFMTKNPELHCKLGCRIDTEGKYPLHITHVVKGSEKLKIPYPYMWFEFERIEKDLIVYRIYTKGSDQAGWLNVEIS